MSADTPYRGGEGCPTCDARTLTLERAAALLSEHAAPCVGVAFLSAMTVVWGALVSSAPMTDHAFLSGIYAVVSVFVTVGALLIEGDDLTTWQRAGLAAVSLHSLTLTMASAVVCAVSS